MSQAKAHKTQEMDRARNQDDRRKKISPAGMPSPETGMNVASMEIDEPVYRYTRVDDNNRQSSCRKSFTNHHEHEHVRHVKITQQSRIASFASCHSGSSFSSFDGKKSLSSLGLKREDFGYEAKQAPKSGKPIGIFDSPPSSLRSNIHQVPEIGFKPVSIKNTWENPQLRFTPSYYPMERSNRIINDHEQNLSEITENLSNCFRALGIQVKYFENPAGAALLTPEQVEAFIYLWKTGGGKQVCVEVQRRRGDSLTFHRYARHILEAASGDFDATEYCDYTVDSHYLKAAEKLLRGEMAKNKAEQQESLMAIEYAANLIKKDRLDARMLGMESLCILTDPRKTSLSTARITSLAVLFGTYEDQGKNDAMFRGIQEFVLCVVQKRCMDDEDSLLKDMVVEYDSEDEEFFDDGENRDEEKPPEYFDCMKTLVNYGLTILANAWEVLTTVESFDKEPESTQAPFAIHDAIAEFHHKAYEFTNLDIITTLLMEVFRAETKMHNACLAAKCLRTLCQASDDVRERTKKFHGFEITERALKIGKQTNARLERACAQLLDILQV